MEHIVYLVFRGNVFYKNTENIRQTMPCHLLKVPSHDVFLFFHNKFAFGEYFHVHSVV